MSEFRTPYPTYDVLDKWDSVSWNDQTREALRQRLEDVPERRFLTAGQWSLLEAIVARLIPQPEREEPVAIVPWIDDRLFAVRLRDQPGDDGFEKRPLACRQEAPLGHVF